jgi:hypothetical protein
MASAKIEENIKKLMGATLAHSDAICKHQVAKNHGTTRAIAT